uniref:Uncharacterized protein n=1 Tax=Phakopsora pachyrhizi TaxID=170000 RepID=A0A0S1MJ95_PHAPC
MEALGDLSGSIRIYKPRTILVHIQPANRSPITKPSKVIDPLHLESGPQRSVWLSLFSIPEFTIRMKGLVDRLCPLDLQLVILVDHLQVPKHTDPPPVSRP